MFARPETKPDTKMAVIASIIIDEMRNRQTIDTSGATTPSCSDSGYQLVDQPKTTAT